MTRYEVVVLGGGPAGCAAATLLATRSHRVALVLPHRTQAPALAESVPPSARRLLEELGLLDAVASAGFHPNTGNTVWWAGGPARSEDFAEDAAGFHCERAALEAALVGAAERAGVTVLHPRTARAVEREGAGETWRVRVDTPHGGSDDVAAAWVLDASGRVGVAARGRREPDRDTTTLALVGRWRRAGGWPADVAGRTAVESYPDGWAWSVPLAPDVRCVTAMVDQRHADLSGRNVAEMLAAELSATEHVAALLEGSEPAGEAWACPASLYTARSFAEPGLLLVGDAASFIDPLSSYGVKKALASGWLAGVVAHTALVDADMRSVALEYFERRERLVYEHYRRASHPFFAEAAAAYSTPFWTRRAEAALRFVEEHPPRAGSTAGDAAPAALDAAGAEAPDPTAPPVPEAAVRGAFDAIRARPRLDAAPGPTLEVRSGPMVRGHRVVLDDHLASAACPAGARYVRGVDLRTLVRVAPRHDDVPDGWAAYNAEAPPVTLPDYLTALSTAFAAGFLVHGPASDEG